jgi:hypothetical protein
MPERSAHHRRARGPHGEPGFWDDPDAAGKVGAEHARAASGSRPTRLLRDVEGLDGIAELVEEDEDLAREFEDTLQSVESGSRPSRKSACSRGATTRATRW